MNDLGTLPLLEVDFSRPFAVLADVHANIEALTVVGEWLEQRGVSGAIVLGDLIGYGASPQETVDFVRERGWPAVRGNHEDMLLDLGYVERTRSLKSSARKALEWTRRSLTQETVDYLDSLPAAARMECDAIALHGSLVDPRHCYAYIYEFSVDRNASCLRELAPPLGTIVWFGHTHQPVAFEVTAEDCSPIETASGLALPADRFHLVNPGSVGFPRGGDPRAAFMIYDASSRQIEAVRLEYDVATAAKKIRGSGYDASLADRLLAAR